MTNHYDVISSRRVPIKLWTKHVSVEPDAITQLENIAGLPFIHKHVAVMPDVHVGKGATVGSVIPTVGAIVPAAVGVDLGCGMMAVKTNITASQLPDNLFEIRSDIEKAVPHGRTNNGQAGDRGAWGNAPEAVTERWKALNEQYDTIIEKYPKLNHRQVVNHLGTLGTGNHFVELCLDEDDNLWVMLHSGSRGIGNAIGSYFIERAKKHMENYFITLPDKDLSYLPESSEDFKDYVRAVGWAQNYARNNREVMMFHTMEVLKKYFPDVECTEEAVNCHHNYISKERHFGQNVWVTRKGAVSAQVGELGIIPGSMGARSFIVRGLGNRESFCSCSHGAGRLMSRTEAKKKFTIADHIKATEGVECRKDADVIDETPMAYKKIEDVMKSQSDLVEPVHMLKQIVCVKG